jgi:acyl carrier protein
MGFDDFASTVARYFDLPVELFGERSRIVEDIGMDSLMIVELVDMLEGAGGHPLHEEAIASLATMGDVHRLYLQFDAGRAAG